jgi:lambda family phage portal protein
MGVLDLFRRRKPEPEPAPRVRSFAAAQKQARYGDLKASRGSADTELVNGLAEVRAKARYLGRNSPAMRRYIQLMRMNIVGPQGFRFQSRVRRADGTMDKALNDRVETQWGLWWAQPHVDGRTTGLDLLRTMISQYCLDGEILWEIVVNPIYRDRVAINPLEPDHLDETLNTINPATGHQIRMSVEFDTFGRIVAYHLLTSHPGDMTWYRPETKTRYRRVLAENIIHVRDVERAGQTRGTPPAASIINPIKMLDGYREATTVGRRLRAALMGFFYREQPGPSGIAELADTKDDADNMLEMTMEPGVLKELPSGLRFDKFDPGGEQTDYAEFVKQEKTEVATGLGISVMSLGMETSGVSYSSGRTIVVEDRSYYREMQAFFIRNAMVPLFRFWLRMNMLSATSDIPPSRADAVLAKHVFRPRGWDWVDPAKDVSANAEAIATGQKSLTSILAERGVDINDHLDEIQAERQAIENMGLTFVVAGAKPDVSEEDDQNDDDGTNPRSADQ